MTGTTQVLYAVVTDNGTMATDKHFQDQDSAWQHFFNLDMETLTSASIFKITYETIGSRGKDIIKE